MTQQFCALTVRKLKPGAWEDFRAAWDPRTTGGEFPPFIHRMYHVRSLDDPDTVISFGLAEGEPDAVRAYMAEPERMEQEARRQEAIAKCVVETGVDGVFEVIDEIVPARTS
jgi:hypothetical protein